MSCLKKFVVQNSPLGNEVDLLVEDEKIKTNIPVPKTGTKSVVKNITIGVSDTVIGGLIKRILTEV